MSRWAWLKRSALSLWERARNEHSSPREIGLSFGLGVFAGCTPAFGLHMWVAIALATALRLNRLWAFLGSRVSFTPLWGCIVVCEIEAIHRLRTGSWASLVPRDAAAHAGDYLAEWLVGTLVVGGTLGLLAGAIAYLTALRLRAVPQSASDGAPGDATRPALAAARSPSSESPP